MPQLLPKSDLGFAPIILVAIIFSVLVVSGSAYIAVKLLKNSPSNSPQNLSTENVSPPTQNNPTSASTLALRPSASIHEIAIDPNCKFPDINICRYLTLYAQNLKSGKPINLTVTTTSLSQDGSHGENILKTDSQGNKQIIISKDRKELLNTIVFKGQAYISTDGGEWTTNPEDISLTRSPNPSDAEAIRNSYLSTVFSTDLKYIFIDTEPCDDKTCYKYQTELSTLNPPLISFIWFDNQDYLLRKEDPAGLTNNTLNKYSYEPVKIEPPANFTIIN